MNHQARGALVAALLAASALAAFATVSSPRSVSAADPAGPWTRPEVAVPTDRRPTETPLSLSADGRLVEVQDGLRGPGFFDRSSGVATYVPLGHVSPTLARIVPDGSAVLITPGQDVVAMSLPGFRPTNLTAVLPRDKRYQTLDVSSDGRFIVVVGEPFDSLVSTVHVVDTVTMTAVEPMSALPGDDHYRRTGAAISDDGRYVVLHAAGSCGQCVERLYRWDRTTGAVVTVDDAWGGTPPGSSAGTFDMSSDGRHVTFVSGATNFWAEDEPSQPRLYIRDMDTRTTRVLAPQVDGGPTISADGRRIAFIAPGSTGWPGDTHLDSQAWVWDDSDDVVHRVSPEPSVERPADPVRYVTISADGSTVAYRRSSSPNVLVKGPPFAPPLPVVTSAFVVPGRLLDTRSGPGIDTVDRQYLGSGTLEAGGTIEVQVAGRNGIPRGVTAAAIDVIATDAASDGFLTVYPCGEVPGTSTVNFTRGATRANSAIAPLSPSGSVCIYSSARTHVVVDSGGGFLAGSGLVTFEPARLLDTRSGPGYDTVDHRFVGGGVIRAGSTLELLVTGRAGIPSDAASLVVNVTATAPAAAGYLTVHRCGQNFGASTLNYTAGSTIANAALVPIGAGGAICISASSTTHVVVDASGAFTSVRTLLPLSPARLLDTRSGPGIDTIDHLHVGLGAIPTGTSIEVPIAGRGGVPLGAVAAAINLTAVGAAGEGYITLSPCGTRPNTSSLNLIDGAPVAKLTTVSLSPRGSICVYASTTTHVVLDVGGALVGS